MLICSKKPMERFINNHFIVVIMSWLESILSGKIKSELDVDSFMREKVAPALPSDSYAKYRNLVQAHLERLVTLYSPAVLAYAQIPLNSLKGNLERGLLQRDMQRHYRALTNEEKAKQGVVGLFDPQAFLELNAALALGPAEVGDLHKAQERFLDRYVAATSTLALPLEISRLNKEEFRGHHNGEVSGFYAVNMCIPLPVEDQHSEPYREIEVFAKIFRDKKVGEEADRRQRKFAEHGYSPRLFYSHDAGKYHISIMEFVQDQSRASLLKTALRVGV